MFRLRRYRLFLVAAVLSVLTVYHLTNVRNWEVPDFEGLTNFGHKAPAATSRPAVQDVAESSTIIAETRGASSTPLIDAYSLVLSKSRAPESQSLSKPQPPGHSPTTVSFPPTVNSGPKTTTIAGDRVFEEADTEEESEEYGKGRLDMSPPPSDRPKLYWQPPEEYFPIPQDQLKPIPTGSAKTLPKIQYDFETESEMTRVGRVQKLETIKDSFKHAWTGYVKGAMPHDELKPVSFKATDPFCGWGATLVDSLDSLWIMGLIDEFEVAVDYVSKIDFTTSTRKDIPLFETVIRYLGGLVAAHDLSAGKYPVLLDKAVELADILMGAFDTPNRMPVTYYNWAPLYTSQEHRANTHVVLAELGSLSVEFTRLAQMTQEARFYDAVARITDALELLQMKTTLPGLWPIRLDASGCRKAERGSSTSAQVPPHSPQILSGVSAFHDGPVEATQPMKAPKVGEDEAVTEEGKEQLEKRQIDDAAFAIAKPSNASETERAPLSKVATNLAATTMKYGTGFPDVDCEDQGLAFEPRTSFHSYGVGGMADSTYEYLPKEYMLLGAKEQYRTMYENAMIPIREKLLYRPMTKNSHDVLFIARADWIKSTPEDLQITYEGSHLGCFAGGMFALGSKLFGIKDDLDIAKKLTDGCVWAYNSTATGIMPEEFHLAPCDNRDSCAWNETRYYHMLDPHPQQRIEAADRWNQHQKKVYEAALRRRESSTARSAPSASAQPTSVRDGAPLPSKQRLGKRQLVTPEIADATTSSQGEPLVPTKTQDGKEDGALPPNVPSPLSPAFQPRVALSHEHVVKARIEEERLPAGFVKIKSREYKLRPEAIESVFIMYRLTGDQHWRDAGWIMFNSIIAHTRTDDAHSAINDVTSQVPKHSDTMESFWLAETLKYFYLLFSEPDVISLDDYVLNTEAHPFRLSK